MVSKISTVCLHKTVLQLNIWWHLNNYLFVCFHEQHFQNTRISAKKIFTQDYKIWTIFSVRIMDTEMQLDQLC